MNIYDIPFVTFPSKLRILKHFLGELLDKIAGLGRVLANFGKKSPGFWEVLGFSPKFIILEKTRGKSKVLVA